VKFGPATLVINYAYQYKDHLGNIRLNFGKDPETNVLRVLEENHYYPFGLKHQNYNTGRRQLGKKEEILAGNLTLMPAFVLPTEDKPMAYKYKYNGKEWQDELGLNFYDYGARLYDPAVGRFFVLDLFSEQYANRNPYHYVSNNPVSKVDIEGHFEIDVKDQKTYKTLTNYLKNGIGEILSNSTIMNGLQKYGGFSEQQVRDKIVKFGKGSIKLDIRDDLPFGANGYYMGGTDNPIQISKGLVEQIENAKTEEERELAILSFLITALHESVHYGDWTHRGSPLQESFKFNDDWGYPVTVGDIGTAFEVDVFWDGKVTNFEPNAGKKTGKEGMNSMKKLTKSKLTNGKLKDLTQGIQDFIKKMQQDNPDVEIFIIE
jgi:RHS repeat-associated protein